MPTITQAKTETTDQREPELKTVLPPLEEAIQLSWLDTEKKTFTWQSDSFLQCVFVLDGQMELFLPEHGKSTVQAHSWFALSLDGWERQLQDHTGDQSPDSEL